MRIALHTGKGGVGKSTVSAMTAIAAAARGRRVLLLSTDSAHSVADVLGCEVGSSPTPVPGAPGMDAAQVDTRGRFEQAWSAIREYLVGVLAAGGMARVQAEELTVLPGAAEIIALLEVQRWASSAEYDAVVVDCAPSADTLRLLALPETIGFYSGRLMGTPTRLLRTVAASMASAAPRPRGPVKDAFGEMLGCLQAAREVLADSAITGFRLVVTPEQVVVAEARRLYTALALHGFPARAVVVNRVLPGDAGGGAADNAADGAFLDSWRAAQAVAMARIGESFPGLDVHRVPMTATEPVGVGVLSELANRVFGDGDPMADTARSTGLTVTASGAGYRLTLPLPQAERAGIDLVRSGVDLVVTVGPLRRRLTLPSVLQRCVAIGARFTGEDLLIDFEPDPAQWPASLAPPAHDLAGVR